MKYLILSVGLIFGSTLSSVAREPVMADTVLISSGTVVWPDYKKDFKKEPEQFFSGAVQNDRRDWGNRYIVHVDVILGSAIVYLDNQAAPKVAVMEQVVLGNDSSMRVLLANIKSGWVIVDTQLFIDSKWVSGRSGVRIYLTDPEKLLKEGKMSGVLLVMDPLDSGPPLELRLENKLEK